MDEFVNVTNLGAGLAVTSLLLAVGCSDDPGPDPGGDASDDVVADTGEDVPDDRDAGTTDTGMDTVVDTTADTAGDTGTDDGGSDNIDRLPGRFASTVTVSQLQTSEGPGYSAWASFTDPDTAGDDCSVTRESGCRLVECDRQIGEGNTESVSAGTVEITGGQTDVTLSPNSDGSYDLVQDQGRIWSGSETLTVDAAGDVVPGFEETLTPPAGTQLEAPQVPSNQTDLLTIDRSSPLTVEWSTNGLNDGTFWVSLTSNDSGNNRSATIDCGWDATAGSRDVPSSLLQQMPTGEAVQGSFRFSLGVMTQIQAGDYDVAIMADSPVDNDGVGDGAGGRVFYE